MKHFVETSWYIVNFKENHTSNSSKSNKWSDGIWQRNYWQVDGTSLQESLNQLTEFCDEHGYEIKGIVPIDRAQSYEYGQAVRDFSAGHSWGWGWGWGLGKGWGITMSDGFVAILQRVELLTDEEYSAKVTAVKKAKEEKIRLEEEKKRREQEITSLESSIFDDDKEIKEKEEELNKFKIIINKGLVEKTKGLMKKKICFKVGDEEFENVEHAEKYLKDLQSMTDDFEKKINNMKADVSDKRDEIKKLADPK